MPVLLSMMLEATGMYTQCRNLFGLFSRAALGRSCFYYSFGDEPGSSLIYRHAAKSLSRLPVLQKASGLDICNSGIYSGLKTSGDVLSATGTADFLELRKIIPSNRGAHF